MRSLRLLRSQKEHIFETEKTLNFVPKGYCYRSLISLMFQNGFVMPQIDFKFDSIKRKNGFHVCSNNEKKDRSQTGRFPELKVGSNRNEIGSFWSHKLPRQLRFRFVILRFKCSFMNVLSFEPYSDHFARTSYVVAFQIHDV